MSTVTAAIFGAPAPEDILTEAGAAERFARRHGEDVRYDHARQRWLLWAGHRWRPDPDAGVRRLALEFARAWQREAVEIADRDRREAVLRHALRYERNDAQRALLDLARTMRPIADTGQGWDADPWILGVPNGVVDLRTGVLRSGQRRDRISLTAGVAFDRDARSVLWDRALTSILVDETAIGFLQVAAGYSATADTSRDAWFLAFGHGRNGKGTLLNPIRRALGEYAAELPASVFDARRDAASYDLAVLPGKRLITCSEAGDTIKLNHDRIKQITGGDALRAANKYEKSVEFTPVAKLWLTANRKPRVADDSPAFWARVMLIPFAQSFVGREDRTLRPALEQDPTHQAAVLAWIVRGAVSYAAEGLHAPDLITAATASYQTESDPLAEFLEDACEADPEAEVAAADLFEHYQHWARAQGMTDRDLLTQTMFGRLMSARLPHHKIGVRKHYIGVARRSL